MKRKNVFILLLTSLLMFSCGSDDGSGSYSEPEPEAEVDPEPEAEPEPEVLNLVRLSNDSTFGNVLTNTDGFTLYFFAPDANGDSNCLDGCANTWPAFFAENLTLDEGLETTDFGAITRSDGQMQNTYKGWPLYTFINDTEASQINGDGAGGTWFVGKPDYSVMLVRSQLVGRDADGNETNLNSSFEPGDEETFYITDDRGNTLYSFINDENGVNNFTTSDFSNNGVWPIFHTDVQNIPSTLNTDDFEVIDVFGEAQLTYKGWPLYKFSGDDGRGDNFGVGFPSAGVWPTLNSDTEPAPINEDEPVVVAIERTFEVDNVGATAYVFGFTDVQNPELELTRGKTYAFNVNTPGHPFIIKSIESTGTDNAFNDGVTDNGTADGTILFTVPADAPDILFYNCEFHALMSGRIRIVNENTTTSFVVGNNGATSYTFSGTGFDNLENTNFTFKRGRTYTFNVSTPGHPFIIKSVQGTGAGNAFDNGVTNNGASDGTITFQVPDNAPDILFYNCEFHGSMTGTISIID